MRKIISLFQRDYIDTRLVYNEIVPGAEWVVNGEGVATIKLDGTACLVRGGKLYRRYDRKAGRTPPPGWEPCEDAPNENTGHWPGWVPVGDGPADKWYRVAWKTSPPWLDWTYELIGPRFQSNPYRLEYDFFVQHGVDLAEDAPRTFAAIREWLAGRPDAEGLVWWRDIKDVECDKVKIKRRDFGLPWPVMGEGG